MKLLLAPESIKPDTWTEREAGLIWTRVKGQETVSVMREELSSDLPSCAKPRFLLSRSSPNDCPPCNTDRDLEGTSAPAVQEFQNDQNLKVESHLQDDGWVEIWLVEEISVLRELSELSIKTGDEVHEIRKGLRKILGGIPQTVRQLSTEGIKQGNRPLTWYHAPKGRLYSLSRPEPTSYAKVHHWGPGGGVISTIFFPCWGWLFICREDDGGLHSCIDYHRLNQITDTNLYPLPEEEPALCESLKMRVPLHHLLLPEFHPVGKKHL